MAGAWWISPRGEAIKVTEHALYVAQHPEVFGLEPGRYKPSDIRKRREDILIPILMRGWIRVRDSGLGPVQVNVGRLTNRAIENIYNFFAEHYSPSTKIVLTDLQTGERAIITPADLFVAQPLEMSDITSLRAIQLLGEAAEHILEAAQLNPGTHTVLNVKGLAESLREAREALAADLGLTLEQAEKAYGG